MRRVLDKETLRNLYFSFIYPYLTYCVHVWGNSAKTYLAHLQKLQKKIVRVITFSKFNSHTQPLMYELKLLNILKKNHLFTVGIFIFKYVNGELPDAFDGMFSYRHEIHDYNARGANQLHMEQFPTNTGLKGMRYYGAKLWNNIFLNFTDMNYIYSLKVRFKNMLLDNNMLEEKLIPCIWWWEMYHYYLEGLPKYKEVQFNKKVTNSALVYSVIQNVYKNRR